jgi:hypothetical protein
MVLEVTTLFSKHSKIFKKSNYIFLSNYNRGKQNILELLATVNITVYSIVYIRVRECVNISVNKNHTLFLF